MQHLFHAIGITNVWQLIAATAIFLMLPGPGTFCILTCSARQGLRGGFVAVIGLMMGDILLMFLAAIGVAAMLHANPLLFKAVQYIGAVYLAFLGCRLLFARSKGLAEDTSGVTRIDFRRSFFVTLMNPKAIVFYMAFFPLFIDPVTQRGALTFIAMGSVICTCTLLYGSLLVFAGNTSAKRLSHHRRLAKLGTRTAGIFLILFGLKLGTQ